MLPVIMTTLQNEDNKLLYKKPGIKKTKNSDLSLGSLVMIISVIILLVACSRGSLSSLKFFEL